MTVLDVGGRALSRPELEGLADPAAARQAGRWAEGMTAIPFRALVDDPRDATHVTFHAADGYAASLPIEQALADAVVLLPPDTAGRTGVRLVVSEGNTTCLNVKAVRRIELSRGPGKHTVDPNPHTPARVAGWDE
jgi:DMSO/TMAO reductase YedYZ molybdopterin-dependent catalytic subunit